MGHKFSELQACRPNNGVGDYIILMSNSPATSVVVLKLHRWTVAACFVFREKLAARILGLLQHYPPTGDIAERDLLIGELWHNDHTEMKSPD